MKSKGEAAIQLMRDARAEKSSYTSYKRIAKACKILELAPEDTKLVMGYLEYCDWEGRPYQWLAKKLETP